jgi:hypothetical protein
MEPFGNQPAARGRRVRATVRCLENAAALPKDRVEIVLGSFADIASLDAAMAGVDGVFLTRTSLPSSATSSRRHDGSGANTTDMGIPFAVDSVLAPGGRRRPSSIASRRAAQQRFHDLAPYDLRE